jgi:hypothetical protein
VRLLLLMLLGAHAMTTLARPLLQTPTSCGCSSVALGFFMIEFQEREADEKEKEEMVRLNNF